MKFKVGDRVKCVASNSSLEYGKVYEVSNAFSGACDGYVNLVNEGASGWSTSRFELVKEEVSMHKFKVGDVVKIVGDPEGNNSKWDHAEGFHNMWIDDMDDTVGMTACVAGISTRGIELSVHSHLLYPSQALELYTEKTKVQKDKKYRTVNGEYPTRVVCTDALGEYPCVVLYKSLSEETVMRLTEYGESCYGVQMIEEVPEVDWSKVELNTPIWVKLPGNLSGEFTARHFAEFKYGYVYFYADGLTSHTGSLVSSVVKENASLTDPNEKA